MSNPRSIRTALVAAMPAIAAGSNARADLITNGGFESGLSGWTTVDQLGSDGTFSSQTGTASPFNGFAVPAPPEGTRAAMTDSGAGGSHALYQDIFIPSGVTQATIGFALYLNNGAEAYFNPATLDWALTNGAGGTNLNQQARVDFITTAADPFSVATASVLQNLFQTTAQTPLVSGYTPFQIDVTALFQAHAGETLRLRFAETDNVNFFNFGVDDVTITVPAPSVLFLSFTAFCGAFRRSSTRR